DAEREHRPEDALVVGVLEEAGGEEIEDGARNRGGAEDDAEHRVGESCLPELQRDDERDDAFGQSPEEHHDRDEMKRLMRRKRPRLLMMPAESPAMEHEGFTSF